VVEVEAEKGLTGRNNEGMRAAAMRDECVLIHVESSCFHPSALIPALVSPCLIILLIDLYRAMS
jgi:hypothetical protein